MFFRQKTFNEKYKNLRTKGTDIQSIGTNNELLQ